MTISIHVKGVLKEHWLEKGSALPVSKWDTDAVAKQLLMISSRNIVTRHSPTTSTSGKTGTMGTAVKKAVCLISLSGVVDGDRMVIQVSDRYAVAVFSYDQMNFI